MKLLSLLLLCLIVNTVIAQPFNHEISEEGRSPKLLGKINKEGLNNGSYGTWFTKNFDAYEPSAETVKEIGLALEDYRIELFMGTWCGDSKREVPRFYKVLESLDFPLERLSVVAVDNDRANYKQSPGGEHEGKNIHRVPTFILYKDGIEINRIVESPVETLEKDLLNIIQSNYTPNYEGVHMMNKALNKHGHEGVLKRKKKLLKELAPKVERVYDLNTYSNVLMAEGRSEDAIAVARLNLLLFPENAYAHATLASKLSKKGKVDEAITLIEKAILLDPEDKRYPELLNSLQANQ